VGTLILNFIFSALSVLSISLIKPIFEIIFEKSDTIIDSVPEIEMGFLEYLKKSFFDFITSIVVVDGATLQNTLLRFGLLIFGVFLLKNIVKYISGIINCKFEEGVVKNVRDSVFTRLNSLSIDFFNKNKVGNLMSIITNDIAVLNSATINAFNTAFRESFQIIMYVLLLFSISVRLTFITFLAGGFILLVVRLATKHLRRYAKRIQQAMADFTSIMAEMISGIRVVKAFNGEDIVVNRFIQNTDSYVRSIVKHQKISTLVPIFSELAAIGALSIVLLQGGTMILDAQLTSSDLMLFLFAVFSVMAPIISTTNTITQFQRGYVAAERVFYILDQVPSVPNGVDKNVVFEHNIEFKNVKFKYVDNIVLDDINLKIEKGTQVALVGSSGSGKSTMLDLLIRFYDPIEGEILIDGKNIKDYDTKEYRSLFGIVSQENILFNDTVKNNIAFGYTNYSANDLELAAKASNCYDFVSNMTEGFDTYLGDRGVNVSGGERQRIAIARALLRKPKFLIFDEATSALDAESEKLVQRVINTSLENKTAVIVAHRLSTIINCDEIVVFNKGKIVEQGTHKELLAKNGYYANLYNLQYHSKGK
jgi:subfamily B ATP-binding cassette protein MsbA